MRWYNLGGSWAVSEAGFARIMHARMLVQPEREDETAVQIASEQSTAVIVTTGLTESHASPISIAAGMAVIWVKLRGFRRLCATKR